jgi:cytochrome b561
MQFQNTPTRYGVVTKTFHWVMALLIVFMLCLGLYMGTEHDLARKLRLFNLHKSLGVLILILASCRLAWHLYSKKPPFLVGLKDWEKKAAHAVHGLIYAAMFALPLTGWVFSSAAGRAVSFFGLFTLPSPVAQDKALGHSVAELHGYIAYALIGLLCLHVGGALKHFLIDRDKTLQRMLPFGRTE